MGCLPIVGHAVAITVDGGGLAVQYGPGTPVVAGGGGLHVFLAVDDARGVQPACITGILVLHVIHHRGIVTVAVQTGTGILHHLGVSRLGTMGGGRDEVYRGVQLNLGLDLVVPQTVVVTGRHLVVYTVGPVVIGHVAVL